MAPVSLRDVRKAFGSTEVLHGVSVEISDGEFVVLVGPSGCGKSTLLRMIAGLENISRGEIAIGGRVVNRVAPKEREVAMVFQNYALYPHMTVRDNMAFSLMLAKAPKEVIEGQVGRAAWARSCRRRVVQNVRFLDRPVGRSVAEAGAILSVKQHGQRLLSGIAR